MYGKTRKDKIRNECFRELLEVASVEDKIKETRMKWFKHAQHMPTMAPVRTSLVVKVDSPPRGMGRPKRT